MLAPNEVRKVHGLLFILMGDLFPFAAVVLKLLPDEVCVVTAVNAESPLWRIGVFFNDLIHNGIVSEDGALL